MFGSEQGFRHEGPWTFGRKETHLTASRFCVKKKKGEGKNGGNHTLKGEQWRGGGAAGRDKRTNIEGVSREESTGTRREGTHWKGGRSKDHTKAERKERKRRHKEKSEKTLQAQRRGVAGSKRATHKKTEKKKTSAHHVTRQRPCGPPTWGGHDVCSATIIWTELARREFICW